MTTDITLVRIKLLYKLHLKQRSGHERCFPPLTLREASLKQ